jgi:hypothetical protein
VAIRYRWPDDLDPQLRQWLTRVQCVQAHLKSTLLIYCRTHGVGGDSLKISGWRKTIKGNSNYARRAAVADRTILYDALTVAIDEFAAVREAIQKAMDSAPPTMVLPGGKAKVEVMEQRAQEGFSIFIEGDAKH